MGSSKTSIDDGAESQRISTDQSRLSSLIEACLNTAIGFLVTICAQIVIFPLFGIHISFKTNMGVTTCFTVLSVARSYAVRRWFNAYLQRVSRKLAGVQESKGFHYSTLKPFLKNLVTSEELEKQSYVPCDGRSIDLTKYPAFAKLIDHDNMALENWRSTRRFAAWHKFLHALNPRWFPNVPAFKLPDLRGQFPRHFDPGMWATDPSMSRSGLD